MDQIQQIFHDSLVKYVATPIMILCAIGVAIIVIKLLTESASYNRTTYAKQTGKSFFKMRFNLGNYGEYLTYKYLSIYEKYGARFLFNCYLPKADGETTEVDLIMIAKSGIYVFESKNYSGWIFGSENSKNWTQTLPDGKKSRKESFFNPVMQNALHIKALKEIIGDVKQIYSVIVFSERCTLKKIEVSEETAHVIKRDTVKTLVKKIDKESTEFFSVNEINNFYNKLLPYTEVDDSVKKTHIENIKNKHN